MGRGLTRTHSTLAVKRKRARSTSIGGEIVEREDDSFDQVEEETILNPETYTKYRAAATVANDVLREVLDGVTPGASVIDLCKMGDELINAKALPLYSKDLDEDGNLIYRGIAFPTCVNVNRIVCHYHPTLEEEEVIINEGDIVRVELGVHIDGYIASVAHTVIVKTAEVDAAPSLDFTIQCDVLRAAYTAGEAALRLMKPGHTNHDVTEVFQSVAYSFGVMPLQGVLSHRVKRFDEQGEQIIMGWQSKNEDQLQNTFTFKVGQVWSLDVVMINDSTAATNKAKLQQRSPSDAHIFRKSEVARSMRLHAARYVLSVLSENGAAGLLPFSKELFGGHRSTNLGIHMLSKQQLLDSYPIFYCKGIQTVARYKWTVLITPNGIQKITGLEAPEYATPDPSRVDPDVATLLSENIYERRKVLKVKKGGRAPRAEL